MSGTWTTIEIAGKPADVYEPPIAGRPRFGILHLHGLDQQTIRDRLAFTNALEELKLACVCPHGQRSWWANRICSEFDPQMTAERYVLDHVLPFFGQRWGLAARSIGLQGIEMGGQGALRLAFKHPQQFPVVAAIAPAIEYHELYGRGTSLDDMYDSKEQCRQDTAPMHIHPVHYPPHIFFCSSPDDTWFRGNDRLHEKLNALGIAHQVDFSTQAAGSVWPHFEQMAPRVAHFLHAGLEQESRRLL